MCADVCSSAVPRRHLRPESYVIERTRMQSCHVGRVLGIGYLRIWIGSSALRQFDRPITVSSESTINIVETLYNSQIVCWLVPGENYWVPSRIRELKDQILNYTGLWKILHIIIFSGVYFRIIIIVFIVLRICDVSKFSEYSIPLKSVQHIFYYISFIQFLCTYVQY